MSWREIVAGVAKLGVRIVVKSNLVIYIFSICIYIYFKNYIISNISPNTYFFPYTL